MFWGLPICVNTLSSHWRGPWRCTSIQHGVDVTSCRWYSAPQPLTKDILMVHILVNSYTASKPWLTDWESRAANSWLLKIFKLQPGGILHTVVGWKLGRDGCILDDNQVLDAQGTCGGNCSFLIAQRLLSLRGTQRRLPRQRSRDEHPCRCVVECSQ